MNEQDFKQMAAQLRKPSGEEGVKISSWMNQGNLQINHDTLKILNADAEEAILEIGMGNGFFVQEILKDNPLVKYCGCDFSDVMVAESKKINAPWVQNKQAEFIQASVDNLPFEKNSFDKVFTLNTIYFWDNEPAALSELKRVLKADGLLIITLRPKRQMITYPFTKYGFNMFSKEDVVELLEKNGLTVLNTYENNETPFELNGETIRMENLIIVAKKAN